MGMFSQSRKIGQGLHIYRDTFSLDVIVRNVDNYSKKATLELRTNDITRRVTVPYGSSLALCSDLDLHVLVRYRKHRTSCGKQVVLALHGPADYHFERVTYHTSAPLPLPE